ncbi:MAG: hypothetical protein NTU60_11870 [Candidatus Aminicenantes bacterium]|nr:hypothetical protein [Candidatus Aminicenantes bacterium]
MNKIIRSSIRVPCQGTSLRLATRPWLESTGEYGGSGSPDKAWGPCRRGGESGVLTRMDIIILENLKEV